MAMDLSSPSELRQWAETLKERIGGENEGSRQSKGDSKLPTELRDDLLEAVDLLVSQLNQPGEFSGFEPNFDNGLGEEIAEVIDATLAQWQSSIVAAVEQSASRELEKNQRLARELCSSLDEQNARLAEQHTLLAERLSESLRMQSRTSRQRKSIAKDLRAQKAEGLLAIERQRQQLREQIYSEVELEISTTYQDEQDRLAEELRHLQEASAATQAELEQSLNQVSELLAENKKLKEAAEHDPGQQWQEQLEAASQNQASLEEEVLELSSQLEQLQKQLEAAQVNSQEEELRNELTEARNQILELENETSQLKAAADALANTEHELAEVKQLCVELETQLESQISDNASHDTLRQEHDELRQEIDRLTAELQQAAENAASSDSEETRTTLREYERRLADIEAENTELVEQNSDLAAQIAKFQVSATGSKPHMQFDQESLSWEERKRLILQQLEDETDDATDDPVQQAAHVARQLEVKDLVETTEAEIARRDREIEELRSIVEQQSNTSQGVAIGAAAIAQMFESDDLIKQERSKLKNIQQEWEEKLRQAEIDLSMERAKLARERSQLEAELEKVKQAQDNETLHDEIEEKVKGRKRKWLEHLGLKDEGTK